MVEKKMSNVHGRRQTYKWYTVGLVAKPLKSFLSNCAAEANTLIGGLKYFFYVGRSTDVVLYLIFYPTMKQLSNISYYDIKMWVDEYRVSIWKKKKLNIFRLTIICFAKKPTNIIGTYLFVFWFLRVSFARCRHNRIKFDVQNMGHQFHCPARWTPRSVVEIDGHFEVLR